MRKKKQKRSEKKEEDSFKVTPLGDRVLVREDKKDGERKTDSGIIIPETVSEDRGAKKGRVVAVGPGRYEDGRLVPMRVRAGDSVLYQWGDKLTVDGEEYEMVSETSILAVIK